MATDSEHFQIRKGNTFFADNSFEKLVLEAVITATEANSPSQVGLHVESMWLDEPTSIEIARTALNDRDQFSDKLSAASHSMIRFYGNRRQFDVFVAEQLGTE